MFAPKTHRKGDVLRAEDENAANAEIARQSRITGSAGVVVRGGSLAVLLPERIYIKLTSGANANGAYAWKEVLPAPLGAWIDAGRTGTQAGDPAYERGTRDGTLTSGNTVYEAERAAATGEWLFE